MKNNTDMTTGRRRGGHGRRGFTLVEAIATMSIVAVLGSVSSMVIYTAVAGYRDASARAQMHEEASSAFDRLTRALWSISRDTSAGVVAPKISSVTATSMAWDGNWSLTLTGTQLMLVESGGTARSILNNVTSFAIQTYDESNAAIANPVSGATLQNIRRIQLQVTVSREGQSETLRTRVFIRSTMAGAAIG